MASASGRASTLPSSAAFVATSGIGNVARGMASRPRREACQASSPAIRTGDGGTDSGQFVAAPVSRLRNTVLTNPVDCAMAAPKAASSSTPWAEGSV